MKPWVLISGGAGGIGGATARRLNQAGFRPAIGYRKSAAAATALAKECGGEAVLLDLCDASQIEAAARRFTSEPLAALVLNASPPLQLEPFRQTPADSFRRQFEASVIGNHQLLAAVIQGSFRERRSGAVIGVLTKGMGDTDTLAMKNAAAYVVAKYSLLGLLRAAKADHAWLKMDTVSPGYTDTPMLTAFDPRFVELLRQKGDLTDPDTVAQEIVRKIIG